MPKQERQNDELTQEELEKQNGEELPDREVMTLINPGADGIVSTPPFEQPLPPVDD